MALVTNKLNEVLVFGEEPTRITSDDGSVKITKKPQGEIYDLSVEAISVEVFHDDTLVGKGTNNDKLGVNTDVIATKEDIKDFVTGDDLEDYAKKEDIPDVSNFATKDEIPDVSNFPTKDEVASEYQPKGDYALVGDSYTKEESDGKYALKGDVPTDVYTKEEADNKFQEKGDYVTPSDLEDYATRDELQDYAKKDDIPDSYTKQESDGKYQEKGDYVESSTLNNYYTKTEIENNYYSKEEASGEFQPKGDYVTPSDLEDYATKDELQDYALKSDIPDVSNFATKDEIPDISGLATKEELGGKQDTLVSGENIKTINGESILGSGNIEIQGGGMSTVATDDTIDGDGSEENPLSVNVDNLGIEFPTETVGFIADAPLKFYEDDEGRVHIANEGGSGAIETDDTLIGNGSSDSPLGVDTSKFATKEDVSDMLTKDIADSLYQPIGDYVEGSTLNNYYTKTEIENNYAEKSEIVDAYTKTESDERYALKGEAPTDVYTKSEVDNKFATKEEIPDVSGFATKDEIPDSYTKTESDAKYQEKGDYALVGDSYTKSESDSKYALKDDVPSDVYTKSEADEKFADKDDVGIKEVIHDDTLEGKGIVGNELSVNSIPLIAGTNITFEEGENGIVINATSSGDLSNYYTKAEVDAKVGSMQEELVSGENIKTINGESILGAGNITLSVPTATTSQIDNLFNT